VGELQDLGNLEFKPFPFPRRVLIAGSVALALAASFLGVHEVAQIRQEHFSQVYAEEVELPAVTTAISPAAVAIDPTAVIELSTLLNNFIPLAQAHDVAFNADLLTDLQQQSARLGISLPVRVSVAGATNFHTAFGVSALHLPDEAAALAEELTGASEAWIATLTEATSIARVPGDATSPYGSDSVPLDAFTARSVFAPASRAGARAGQPVTTNTVRELTAEFDRWVASEADAAAASAANFRARMVALSRAHGNGRLPAEVLCPIPFSPRFTMRCDVIDSLVDLNNAFRAHFGRDIVVRSGYRANPGTSNHGWGLAVDFGGQMTQFHTAEFNWMIANARQFGWGHAFWAVPGGLNPQPWHWEAMDQIRELTGRWH